MLFSIWSFIYLSTNSWSSSMEKIFIKCNPDDIVADIRAHKETMCPRCGNVLLYRANPDLSKIYGIYCNKCNFSIKMTYKLP